MNVVRPVQSREYEANKTLPDDITDEQWQLLRPMLPPDKPRGRKRRVDLREVLNAILYLLCSGCSWRMPPHDFLLRQSPSTRKRSRQAKQGGERGYDAGKKINGRKHHIVVDMVGGCCCG